MVFKQVYEFSQRLFLKSLSKVWEMAQHDELSSNPRTHANMAMCIPVTVRCGVKRIDGACWFPDNSRFIERSCLKGIRQRIIERDTRHPPLTSIAQMRTLTTPLPATHTKEERKTEKKRIFFRESFSGPSVSTRIPH